MWSTVEFGGRAKYLVSFISGEKTDIYGHGTHIAGIIGGNTYGVAKKTDIYGVKVLDKKNEGMVDGFIKGLDYVATHQAKMRKQGKCKKGVVINMSISTPPSKILNDAVTKLINKNVFLAVSAGNAGILASKRSPAQGSIACVVGGTNENDKLYSDPARGLSSNYGKRVDIFAPGQDILSAASNAATGGGDSPGYMSGTSQAVPHVVGIAALLAAKEGLSGTKALCDRIKQLGTKDVIVNQKKNTVNLMAYNGAEDEPSNETIEQDFCDANTKEGCSPQIEKPFTVQDAVTTGEDPNACSHFKRLHIQLVTAGHIVAGTWDYVNINFGKENTLLAKSPARKEVDEVDIDPRKGFGATDGKIRVSDIKKFTLSLSEDKKGHNPDWWRLKGITLVGTCAGSGRMAQITRFAELYKWMERSDQTDSFTGEIKIEEWQWQSEDKDTATLAVQPPGRPDACSHFKLLEAELKLGNGYFEGTWDDIELCFDGRPKCHILAREPEHGTDRTTPVNLKEIFGSEVIPAPGFRAIKVYSKTGANRSNADTDWWKYDGITLRGHCQGSPRVVEALKFANKDEWVIRKENDYRTQIASGELAANEWRWVKKD
ncbi:hypothetical protein CDD83_6860 [Cordyceps sp. RAO-2017]|nr:hypothetical protein CDD83_6860 [Cordyceps sp. RAO-2017]